MPDAKDDKFKGTLVSKGDKYKLMPDKSAMGKPYGLTLKMPMKCR
jgi:hypothetical protein